MISSIINMAVWIWLVGFGLCVTTLCIKIFDASDILKNKGVLEDREVSLKDALSIMKKYYKVYIPFFNFGYLIKIIDKNALEFTQEFKEELDKRGYIKKDTNKVKDEENRVKKENNKNKSNNKNKTNNNTFEECIIDQIDLCDDIDTLKRINKMYYDMSLELRREYKRIKESASNSELENLLKRIRLYDTICNEAYNKIQYLKENSFSKTL